MTDTTATTLPDMLDLVQQPISDDTQMGLDDLVHGMAETDDAIDVSGVEDEDDALDMRSRWASELNNQGPGDQLEYLQSQGVGQDEIARLLLESTPASSHAALELRRLAGTAG